MPNSFSSIGLHRSETLIVFLFLLFPNIFKDFNSYTNYYMRIVRILDLTFLLLFSEHAEKERRSFQSRRGMKAQVFVKYQFSQPDYIRGDVKIHNRWLQLHIIAFPIGYSWLLNMGAAAC